MLKLVTISRFSAEKGFKRMAEFQDLIQEPFIWDIYGTGDMSMLKPLTKCTYKGITDTPLETIKQYDFLVQLSDTEGMPYVILEALSVGVPCVVTAFPSAYELIEHKKNGYIFDFELKDFIPLKKLRFKYEPKYTIQDWINLIES
jgi:glycosyltransferase involved in cell wall biosynthesis